MEIYESYPARTVVISNALAVTLEVIGFLMLLKASLIFALAYLLLVLGLEFRLIRFHCTRCYYWGRICGFGQGRLSSLFFRKGDPDKFCAKSMRWTDLIPEMMLSLIPLVTGIVLLIISFNLFILLGLMLIVILTTSGNSYVRGKLTCRNCRQREIGCPAEALFSKNKKNLKRP